MSPDGVDPDRRPPPRPRVRVDPLREPVPDTPPRAVVPAVVAAVAGVLAVIVGAVAVAADLSGVRERLTAVVLTDAPETSAADAADTVTVTLAVAGAVAAVVVLLGLLGALQLRGRRPSSRGILVTTSVLAVAGSAAFLIATDDAVAGPWVYAPVIGAGLLVVGTVCACVPAVGRWLRAAHR
ncbi:hypothetical protein [Rhodococcoides corynebacterioides]|uniref:Uncharacterized protein n=1 Tax=Rhodococcoides corynebacterioides TaxID=53972 RepID=A0ABS7NY97_9NOCA|nr:hypothetical protein [Rhodococcus corynebacterioides]MBY6365134.1 hypothetical protein [Rhodococcus corynebacterioides]MBY6406546.1 hypothetical protein [Rhodococcus corynebacterioides]